MIPLTIDIELFHRTMDFHPDFIHGVHKGFIFLVVDHLCSVPPSASAKQVEDNGLVDEQQVTLHLFVEFIRKVDSTHIAGLWLRPLPTHFAGVTYFWDQAQNFISHTDSLQELEHHRS